MFEVIARASSAWSMSARRSGVPPTGGEQFPVEDATVAVDSLIVDWNAEAAESAQSYLDMSGFSCQGLIDHWRLSTANSSP
jgi:hypothetical protein